MHIDYTRFTDAQLAALYSIANKKGKGARPFFADPKAMIKLREVVNKRLASKK
jgi:hypothetical protein